MGSDLTVSTAAGTKATSARAVPLSPSVTPAAQGRGHDPRIAGHGPGHGADRAAQAAVAADGRLSSAEAALRAALTPQIETTKATGLVFLPGTMTGLIQAGVAPIQAVLVQAVVMFLVLAATATTTVVIALGLIRRLFTPTTG
jgi:hypothetical protein